MAVTKKEYAQLVKDVSPPTKSIKTIPCAFLVGGSICLLGQILGDLYKLGGMSQKNSSTLVSITLVFISALLTGLGLYHKLAKIAGAGTLVPITGFANSVVSPAIEFHSEGLVLGLGAKIFIICGPVILYGVSASVIYGFVYWLIKVL